MLEMPLASFKFINLKNEKKMTKFLIIFSILLLNSCAWLHTVQVGEITQSKDYVPRKFEILISQSGSNIVEAGVITKGVLKSLGHQAAGNTVGMVAAVISLFQMGPRTGNPVYNEKYPDVIPYVLYEKCPSGRITGLHSIRETAKYPVVSGEIIKITGHCLEEKSKSKKEKG